MGAVMATPVGVITQPNLCFGATTYHIIQPDVALPCAIFVPSHLAARVTQLPAHDTCIRVIEKIITYRAPFTVVKYLNSSLVTLTISQPNFN